jgi:hypothetical protein
VKRILFSVSAVLIAISGLFLAASPASADGTTTICESHGAWCVGAPTLGANDPVQETTSGRTIDVVNDGGSSYLLKINADKSLCVASNNPGTHVVLHPCSGGFGVVWIASVGPDGISCEFENQADHPANFNEFLSGNNNGSQFDLDTQPPAAGVRQQFRLDIGVIGICGE